MLEAALLCADRGLRQDELLEMFAGEVSAEELQDLLTALEARWSQRGFELVRERGSWRARVRSQVQEVLHRVDQTRAGGASRALLEVLAVIAYTQPCTRGDIDTRRGTALPSEVLSHLLNRGWIEVIGHRQTAQAPALYATTNKFLDDLGLFTLEELCEQGPALALAASERQEEDPDAYAPYDGPLPGMPDTPGETASVAVAAVDAAPPGVTPA